MPFSIDLSAMLGTIDESFSTESSTSPPVAMSLPGTWLENKGHAKKESAAVHDKAKIPIHLWNINLKEVLGIVLINSQLQALEVPFELI